MSTVPVHYIVVHNEQVQSEVIYNFNQAIEAARAHAGAYGNAKVYELVAQLQKQQPPIVVLYAEEEKKES